MVDNSAHVLQLLGHLWRIRDGFVEVKINDVVSIVCDGNLIAIGLIGGGRTHSENRLALSLARGKVANGTHCVFVAEGSDFNGNGEAGTETIAKLGLVDCSI